MSIDEMRTEAARFSRRLLDVKTANPPEGFAWYGYDILGNLVHLDRTLTGEHRNIFDRLKGQPMLDVGAGDGDFAFFLESLGHSVDIVDWPATNWNGLRGA